MERNRLSDCDMSQSVCAAFGQCALLSEVRGQMQYPVSNQEAPTHWTASTRDAYLENVEKKVDSCAFAEKVLAEISAVRQSS